MVERPDTGYADTPSGRIAYQRSGAGAVDVLGVKPSIIPADLMWDEPRLAAFLGRLSRFSRHVWFDQRGTGASDRQAAGGGRLIEDFADDMVAVLDHLGWEQAAILGGLGPPELLFAATHPGRTKALVLINPFVALRQTESYQRLSDTDLDVTAATYRNNWGTPATASVFAPSVAGDPAFRRWYGRCERLALSPDQAYERFRANFDANLRDILSSVTVPTLILYRPECRTATQSRSLAEHLPRTNVVELGGEDFLFFVGDTAAMLDSVEEFLTGHLPPPDSERVLATVVFTDLVGSTEQAVRLGDRRWRDVLATHDRLVRRELQRHRGREVKTMGDGFLATFDGPARAVRFGCAVRDSLAAADVSLRVGIHTGEVIVDKNDVAGIAVHIAQRVQAQAAPSEVLVSRTVVDLVAGSDLRFADRGERHLKGVPQPWRLFAAQDASTA